MNKITSFKARDENGKVYLFDTFEKNVIPPEKGAVYIFTKRTQNNNGVYSQSPLYIGQCGNLLDRIPKHEKWKCVEKYGCTHINFLYIPNEQERLNIETALRHNYVTPCNDQ